MAAVSSGFPILSARITVLSTYMVNKHLKCTCFYQNIYKYVEIGIDKTSADCYAVCMKNPGYCKLITQSKVYRLDPTCPVCKRIVHASHCNETNLNPETQCKNQESVECKQFAHKQSKGR